MARIIKFEGREISVPEDATDAEVATILGGDSPTQEPTSDQEIYASVPYRLAKSMKDPVDAAAQALPYGLSKVASLGGLVENPVSRWLMQEHENVSAGLKEEERQYQAARNAVVGGDAGFDVTRLAGNVVNPINYIPALKVVKGAPLSTKILSGAATGAAQAGLQPVYDDEFLKAKASQLALGAGVGAVIPAGAALVKGGYDVGKDIFHAITPNGYKTLSIDAVKRQVGSENIQEVAEALARAKVIVPGSQPTAADALAGMPSGSPIAAMQKQSLEQAGGSSKKAGERWLENATARAKALSFAGTEDDLNKAIQARTDATAPFYEAVKTSTAKVKTSPVLTYLNDTINNNANRASIADPLKKIREKLIVATETGTRLENIPQMVKSLLDEVKDMMATKSVDGKPQYDVAVLARTKDLLKKQLGEAVPEFKQAESIFKSLSEPVNQMKLGQTLQEKLINPVGNETPASIIKAVDDAAKMIKSSTGMSRFNKIEDVLTPENARKTREVVADLIRTSKGKNPLQKTNIGGSVAGEAPQLPHILSRPVLIMNTALKHVFGDIEEKSYKYMTDLYLNPKELGKVLAATPPKDRSILIDAVMKYGKKAVEANKTAATVSSGKLIGENNIEENQ